jgi:hypothetical protein
MSDAGLERISFRAVASVRGIQAGFTGEILLSRDAEQSQ